MVSRARPRIGTRWLFGLLVGALGCEGSVGGPNGSGPNGTGGGGTAGTGASSGKGGSSGTGASSGKGGGGTGASMGCEDAPAETPLRRLSRASYVNTLDALFGSAAVTGVSAELGQLFPDGENSSVFTANDTRVTQRHVDAWYGITNALSRATTGDAEALEALAGACAVDSPLERDCVASFVTSFGERAFRRPLTSAEADRYLELFDGAHPRRKSSAASSSPS